MPGAADEILIDASEIHELGLLDLNKGLGKVHRNITWVWRTKAPILVAEATDRATSEISGIFFGNCDDGFGKLPSNIHDLEMGLGVDTRKLEEEQLDSMPSNKTVHDISDVVEMISTTDEIWPAGIFTPKLAIQRKWNQR